MIRLLSLAALLICYAASGFTAEPDLICSVDRPVVAPGGTAKVRIWPRTLEPETRFEWSISAGSLAGTRNTATWRLPSRIGRHTVTARAAADGGSPAECVLEVFVVSTSRAGRETGHALLIRGNSERAGYGLYSYFLLGSPPDEKSQERVLGAIATYLKLTPSLIELEELLERSELNANYLPVADIAPIEVTPQWVLEHYDYARARAILSRVNATYRRGPYLLSLLTPARIQDESSQPALLQDLSAVPAHLVAHWYEEFLNHAAQERRWEHKTVEQVALRMRTIVAILALGLPEIQSALEQWIRWWKW